MKLIIYFGLMIVALIITVVFGRRKMKTNGKMWLSFFNSLIVTVFILGFASIWWFLTETDGISQGLGVLYYLLATVAITFINFISLSTSKNKKIH